MNRVPETLCWHCDRMLDSMDPIGSEIKPTPGAISLCMYCGAVATLDSDLRMIMPTRELLDDLETNEEFIQAYMRFAWARQYVMINTNLMRPDQENNPDN